MLTLLEPGKALVDQILKRDLFVLVPGRIQVRKIFVTTLIAVHRRSVRKGVREGD